MATTRLGEVGVQDVVRRERKSPWPEGVLEIRGLCSTCKHAPTCEYPRDPNRPIMFCDEFVGLEVVPKRRAAVSRRGSPSRSGFGADETGAYKGLCRICDRREDCTFPKPEGGVWHCEEYL